MIVCPPLMGDLADFLVMDRTTMTANLKPQGTARTGRVNGR
jgi:hypothetical protein